MGGWARGRAGTGGRACGYDVAVIPCVYVGHAATYSTPPHRPRSSQARKGASTQKYARFKLVAHCTFNVRQRKGVVFASGADRHKTKHQKERVERRNGVAVVIAMSRADEMMAARVYGSESGGVQAVERGSQHGGAHVLPAVRGRASNSGVWERTLSTRSGGAGGSGNGGGGVGGVGGARGCSAVAYSSSSLASLLVD